MRAKRMIFFTRFLIGFTGLFGSGKQAQSNRSVIDFYFRKPFMVFGPDARIPAFVIATFLTVMRVFNVGGFAQIAKPIVRSISVDMVDLLRRPFIRHIQPRQPMREIQRVVQPNSPIPVFHSTTRFPAGRATSALYFPSKFAGVGIVIDKMAKAFGRKFVLHGIVNINHWRECQ